MLLNALQAAAMRCIGSRPAAFYSSSEQVAIEISDIANEAAADIAKSHDWRGLTAVATFVGDGATEQFAAPADFDRMLAGAEVDDASEWLWGYSPFASVNDWMRAKSGAFRPLGPGGWIILGGKFEFFPAPASNASLPYIRSTWATGADGELKTAFTADDDTFALSERLLTLGVIWRWRAWKGLDYGEDMRNFEIALAQEQGRDRGAYVTVRPSGRARHVGTAYPYALGPDIP